MAIGNPPGWSGDGRTIRLPRVPRLVLELGVFAVAAVALAAAGATALAVVFAAVAAVNAALLVAWGDAAG